jgi:hypothetical protein
MKKQTLLFTSLENLCAYSKTLNTGFLLNTKNLTLTGVFSQLQINTALELFKATLIETTEKVYSYNELI